MYSRLFDSLWFGFVAGLCYGKLEAAILVFIIPTLLLVHLVYFSSFPFLPDFLLSCVTCGDLGKIMVNISASTSFYKF